MNAFITKKQQTKHLDSLNQKYRDLYFFKKNPEIIKNAIKTRFQKQIKLELESDKKIQISKIKNESGWIVINFSNKATQVIDESDLIELFKKFIDFSINWKKDNNELIEKNIKIIEKENLQNKVGIKFSDDFSQGTILSNFNNPFNELETKILNISDFNKEEKINFTSKDSYTVTFFNNNNEIDLKLEELLFMLKETL